jgi:hypothetical protein
MLPLRFDPKAPEVALRDQTAAAKAAAESDRLALLTDGNSARQARLLQQTPCKGGSLAGMSEEVTLYMGSKVRGCKGMTWGGGGGGHYLTKTYFQNNFFGLI